MMVKPKKIDGLLNVEEFHKIENTLQLVISLPDSNKVYLRIVRTNLGKYFVVDDDDVFFPNIAFFGSNSDDMFNPITFDSKDEVRPFVLTSIAVIFELKKEDFENISVVEKQIS
jgi:hypothetical protein